MGNKGAANRCKWVNLKNPAYIRYHDTEWGVPQHKDEVLFEMLFLEWFQAGLSWECILNKREGFRRAFDGFDAEKISRYEDGELARLLADPGIVRNRLKIRTASPLSDRIAADLKKRGMKFVGSTVIYSYLQAIGVLNAHGKECGFCAQEPLMAAQEPDAFS